MTILNEWASAMNVTFASSQRERDVSISFKTHLVLKKSDNSFWEYDDDSQVSNILTQFTSLEGWWKRLWGGGGDGGDGGGGGEANIIFLN